MMLSVNFDSIWELMTKYSFKSDSDSTNEELTCFICKTLMIDACQSGCGCQYCHKCINEYLNGEEKYCPGGNTECQEEYLVMDRNVMRNIRMNKKVFRYIVQCPNEFCEYKDEIGHIAEHIRVCHKQIINCPYVSIGCDHEGGPKDMVTIHLYEDALKHSDLLIKYIQNLNNEFENIKQNPEGSKKEQVSIEEDSTTKEERMKEEKADIVLLKKELDSNKKNIEELWKVMESLREGSSEAGDLKTEVERLKEDFLQRKLEILSLKEESKKEKEEMEDLKREIELLKDNFKKTKTEGKESKKEINDRGKYLEDKDNYKVSLNVDFVWKIEEMSKKIRTMKCQSIFSDSFYSNLYKMCLCLCIYNDEDDIYLGCVFIKGENDAKVQWPMKAAVTLCVVDQESLEPYHSVTFTYDTYEHKAAFDRPQGDMNEGYIGQYPFISYSAIKDNPSVIKEDRLVISCVLSHL